MRLIALLFAFVLSACATPVRAETQALDPIATCLATAEREDSRACIGVVAEPCMEEPAGVSTVGMINCFTRERELWEAEVTRLVALFRDQESQTQILLLNMMLASHEQWMRARCDHSASIFEGGSMAGIVAAACVRTTTAELAIDLRRRLDEG